MNNQSTTGNGFTLIDHPSDVGIEATGKSLEHAFKNAAEGLLSLIAERSEVRELETRSVCLASTDLDNLLVKWLSEILYLFDGEKFLPATIVINELSPNGLKAEISGESFDPARHKPKLDVKAITYHQLKIARRGNRCVVRVFVDI